MKRSTSISCNAALMALVLTGLACLLFPPALFASPVLWLVLYTAIYHKRMRTEAAKRLIDSNKL